MENMDYDVGKAFAAIENELLDSMMRNMKRHRVEETKEGFQWEQWQAKQLAGLEEYRRKHKGKLEERYEAINSKMRMAILQANAQGKMAQEKKILEAIRKGVKLHKASDKLQGEFFRINERKMDALLDAVEHDMLRAESAILRMHDDQVRRAIFNAQIYANSGAGTYEKAVDMAVKDYASTGLNCVKYKDGKQVNIKSYAEMALRTASKRAYLSGEGTKRQEWGIHTVIMNKRGNACPLCLPWVGRVLIDDVWSGGTAKEASKQGYPLMSAAMAAGLYHPNCRDSHTTYFPDISTPPNKRWKKSELEAIEAQAKREARKQYAKRQQDKYSRLERTALAPEDKRMYAARREEWNKKEKAEEIGILDEYKIFVERIKQDQNPSKHKSLMMLYSEMTEVVSDENITALFAYSIADDVVKYNAKYPYIADYDMDYVFAHEVTHRMDILTYHSWNNEKFIGAIDKCSRKVYDNKREVESWFEGGGKFESSFAMSDIVSALSNNKIHGIVGHDEDYWERPGNKELETFANISVIDILDLPEREELKRMFRELYDAYEEIVK